MAINFIVETGTGLEASTSYASVEQFQQYHLDIGTDYSTIDEDKIKGYLNKATAYVDMSYRFDGLPYNDTQALSFPRYDVYNRNDVYIPLGKLPKELIAATCYLAGLLADGTEINLINEGVASQSIAGISKTFNGQMTFPVVDRLLAPYVIAGSKLVRVM